MTTQEKLIRKKQSLLELAEYLQNVSQACKINGVSRQHFYDIKRAYEEEGLEGLREKTRRKPCMKNRVSPEIEAAVLQMAYEYPAYGQTRAANELRKQGVLVSSGGVRSIWLRHGLETFKKRLRLLEEKAAREGVVYTEAQLVALEAAKRERESHPDEIETAHPGYLLSQDTFYVGYLKGVGRIYQQTAIDTYSSVAFAKVYTAKVPVTAADLLNDRVLSFFEHYDIPVLRVLTDRGTEFCGTLDKHPYELFLQLNDIDHTKTKAKSPQTNGICERAHQTILNEFYRVTFRKKVYGDLETLQSDLDDYMYRYNHERTHQGKRCQGRTPMATFLEGMNLFREKNLVEKLAA
ncbi:MAG: Integrase core domain protein [Deltaproteobacteria bacterium ADurb.Bin072]|jgi:transposase InsO family protein|nr:MAG: Integrase core domain protein [Deltaproteobacteria bacterium ADurb.Bin072]